MRRIWLVLAVVLWGALAIPGQAAPIPVGGRIVDSDGRPLRGAAVELVPMVERFVRRQLWLQGKAHPEPAARTASGEDGRFEVAAPAPGMWQVRVSARGFLPRLHELTPLIETAEIPLLEMVPDVPLRVRVLDPQGKPVPGAQVGASGQMFGYARWAMPLQLVVTAADGTAQVARGKQGAFEVEVLAPGFAVATLRVGPSDSTAEIRLAPGCARPLRVTVQEKGDEAPRPVTGALVTAIGWTLGVTDAAGAVAVSVPCDGDLRAEVTARDGRSAEVTLRRPPAAAAVSPGGAAPLVVRLPARPARTSGQVLEDGSRKPVVGALVWPGDDPAAYVLSDAKGGFTVQTPVGEYAHVAGAAAGYLQSTQAAPAAASPTLLLKPLATVSGKVVDEAGQPVPDAVLRAVADPDRSYFDRGGLRARSNPQGLFQLQVMPGQATTLLASHPDFTAAKLPLPGLAARESRTGLEVVMKKGLTGFGRVADAQGRPVAGAQVSLSPEVAGDDPYTFAIAMRRQPGPPVITDAQGVFVMEHLEPGRFELEATARGFAPTLVPGLELADGQGRVDLGTITLAPGATLEGVVVDPGDRPIAGAEVRVHGEGRFMRRAGRPSENGPVLTAADGSFSVPDLRPGESVRVYVGKRGYTGASLQGIEAPTAEPLRVVLKPGSKISGRVADAAGEPVSDAFVELSALGAQTMGFRSFGGMAGSGRTEADGRFTLEGVEAGKFSLTVSARGYLEAELPEIVVVTGKDVEGLEVVLERGASVTGRVVGGDGAPVPGAAVRVVTEDFSTSSLLGIATADGDGNYRLEGVAPGARSIAAESDGFQRAVRDLEVRPGENRLDFRLETGHDVAGRVVDMAGRPVAGARVQLNRPGQVLYSFGDGPGTQSGADGSFRIPAVATGVYELQAEKDGYAPGRLEAVTVSALVQGIEVRLEAGGVIRGQLSGVDFADLASVQVLAGPAGPQQVASRRGRVDFQGQYRVEGLAAGEWKVIAALPDGRQADGEVTVTQGAEAVLDLEIGGGHTLTGRVLRAGEPVANVNVSVSAPGLSSGNDRTDPQGAFRFAGLRAGSYELMVMDFESGLSQEQTVEVSGDREIVVEISTRQVSGRVLDATDQSPLGKVVLTLEHDGSAGLAGRSGRFHKETASGPDGAFTFTNVAPGSYRLLARLDGYAGAETPVQVSATADADGVRLALEPTEGLTFLVSRTVGAPPSDVWVALLNEAGRSLITSSFTTGENGRVRVPSAPPGRWRLLVSVSGSATMTQTVQVPGPSARVVLPPASTLLVTAPGFPADSTVTVLGSDGQPFRGLAYSRLRQDWPMFDGIARIEGLPPGSWRVRVTSPDGQTREASATVAPGSTSQIAIP